MRLPFGFELVRVRGKYLGGIKAQEKAILDLQERTDKLERHQSAVLVKTEKELSDEQQIQQILAGQALGEQPKGEVLLDLVAEYHNWR